MIHANYTTTTNADTPTARGMIAPLDGATASTCSASSTASPTRGKSLSKCVKCWMATISKAWFALQITHYGGQYSIERLLALEEYTHNASVYRVMLVLIISPLPTIMLALCQESIPLQNPTEGWSANYGFWFRVAILALVLGYGVTIHVRHFLDGAALSWRQTVMFCICVGACYTSGCMVVAALWVFPIPFINISLTILWMIAFAVSFYAVAGGQAAQHILSQREQLRNFNRFSTVQMIMVSVYPAYQVLFNATNHTLYELPVLLLLPVLKIILKNVFTTTMLDKEDTIPQEIIFTIDFFDALYLATFMQTASTTTVFVIMAVDVVQTVTELHDLHHRTRGIRDRIGKAASLRGNDGNLLSAVRLLCSNSEPEARVRVRSTVIHSLSPEGQCILERLGSEPQIRRPSIPSLGRKQSLVNVLAQPSPSEPTAMYTHCWKRSYRVRSAAVLPKDSVLMPNNTAPDKGMILSTTNLDPTKEENCIIFNEALEVLFTAECLVLAEYLEAVVPLLYATFVLVMVHLPSAQYHREMVGVTHDNVDSMMHNVFIYALLELLSLAALAIITWRNCGIRVLHQLAFVLETQMPFVQCKLILYLLLTLTYRVAHFGTLNPEDAQPR